MRGDGGVALPDARRLDDHEVEPRGGARGRDVVERRGHLGAGLAGRQRAEEDDVRVDAVHPDAVAEQGAAPAPAGRVDGEHGDAHLVLAVPAQAADELVGERGLARAAGAGDAEDGDAVGGGGRAHRGGEGGVVAGLEHGDRPGECALGARAQRAEVDARPRQVDVALGHELVDHPGEAEALAVGRGEDPYADRREPLDLGGHDHATAPAEHPDVPGAALGQPLHQVREVLHVPALVRRHRDALDVLLDRGGDDVLDAAVVPEMDHLGALRLQQASHDVDGGVVAVEQARGGHEAHRVGRYVQLGGAHGCSRLGCRGAATRQIVGHPTIGGP